MRNFIIFGVVFAALAGLGALLNSEREKNSACSDERFKSFVFPEAVDRYLSRSDYYAALTAALAAENLDPGQRPAYQQEFEVIEAVLEKGFSKSQEISPSSTLSKTCRYILEIQPRHRVIVRFVLEFENLSGTEFETKYAKRQRNIILLEELQPGVPVETVSIAEFGRRTIVIEEPEFRGARYDLRFTPDVVIPEGVISEIPE